MKPQRRFATLFGLGALLVSQIAFAQRVVVLPFAGDKRDRIRAQIVRALQDANEVELVSLKDFARVAAKKGLTGSRAMTPAGVAATSKPLGIAVALAGTVAKDFSVRILDANGSELWSKTLPVKRGEISPKNAGRLAKALAAAARAAQGQQPTAEATPAEPADKDVRAAAEQKTPEVSLEIEKPTVKAERAEAKEQPPQLDLIPTKDEGRRALRVREEEQESHTITGAEAAREESREEEFEPETRRRKRSHIGPKLVKLFVGGTTTWRSYCARPGVTSCREFDAKPEGERPPGDTVDFSPQVPYAGFGVGIEFFPLASFDNPANGIGLSAAFSRGFSLTNVKVQIPGGEQPEQRVISIDDSWHAFAHYRYYFGYGSVREPLVGYVGVRGGIEARTFEVDQTARVPLPGSHRRFPAVGVEASVPVVKLLRLEAGGLYFIAPTAGVDELAGFGAAVSSTGWSVDAGIAGDIWGPIGYSLKFRWMTFHDTFTGQGQKWPNGGAAEETYDGLFWGVTAAF